MLIEDGDSEWHNKKEKKTTNRNTTHRKEK